MGLHTFQVGLLTLGNLSLACFGLFLVIYLWTLWINIIFVLKTKTASEIAVSLSRLIVKLGPLGIFGFLAAP